MAKKSSKIKALIACLLAATVVAGGVVGGSLAYLQDEDSDVNVMTLGNVQIEQLEYERALNEDGTYKTDTIDNRTSYVLQDFTQGKPLVPSALNTTTWEGWGWDGTPVRNSQVGSYGGMSVFKDASNAQDKFVFVKNTGKTDAYVRTLVAVEIGSSTINMMNFNVHLGAWTENEIGEITIDGNNYYVLEYVYTGAQLSDGSWRHKNGILPAGDTTYNSFAQIYLHSKATNEDVEELDGNDNGTLDILVLSQAVQAAGFENAQTALDTAFGKSSEKAAEWFGGENGVLATTAIVNTQEDLDAAIAEGKNVILEKGTYTFPGAKLKEGMTLECADGVVFEGKSSLNVNGATVVGGTFSNSSGNAVSGTINGTFKDCTFTGSNALRSCYAGETVVFENCVFDGSTYGVHFDGGANDVIFKNCTFSGFNAMGAAIPKLTLENCTFKATGKSGYNGINLWGDTDLINCTFVFDGTAGTEWVDLCDREGDSDKTATFTNCVVSDGTTTRAITNDDVENSGNGAIVIK